LKFGDDPYEELSDAMLRLLSLQRCGQDLDESWAGSFAHKECHTDQANLTGYNTLYDVSGGWHDAGDYGKYMKTGTKAVNDLLFAYMRNPGLYDDDNQGPDSHNGIPDILDEAKYELEWMLKMQEDNGGVHVKVVSWRFCEDVDRPAE